MSDLPLGCGARRWRSSPRPTPAGAGVSGAVPREPAELDEAKHLLVVQGVHWSAVFFEAMAADQADVVGESERDHAVDSAARHGNDDDVGSPTQLAECIGDAVEQGGVVGVRDDRGEDAVDVEADQERSVRGRPARRGTRLDRWRSSCGACGAEFGEEAICPTLQVHRLDLATQR